MKHLIKWSYFYLKFQINHINYSGWSIINEARKASLGEFSCVSKVFLKFSQNYTEVFSTEY